MLRATPTNNHDAIEEPIFTVVSANNPIVT